MRTLPDQPDIFSRSSGLLLDYPDTLSRLSGHFLDCPETSQFIRTLCILSGYFVLQSVRMSWKVSRQSKKCPDNLENVSALSKKSLDDLEVCLDNLESFWMILKVSG